MPSHKEQREPDGLAAKRATGSDGATATPGPPHGQHAGIVRLQRLAGNKAVVQLLASSHSPVVQRSALSNQVQNLIRDNEREEVFRHLGANHAVLAADADTMALIARTYSGDLLWVARAYLNHGPHAGWPLHVKVERAVKAGGLGKAAVFTMLRGSPVPLVGDALLAAALGRIFPAGSVDLWVAQNLQTHGPEANWPIHLQVERAMKPGGGGASEVFSVLRTANGAAAADPALTAALQQVFAAGSNEAWVARALQQHGPELGWSLDLKIDREMLSDGGGRDRVMDLLRAAHGASAGAGPVTAAIHNHFGAGTNDRWLAERLQAAAPESVWTNDLLIERNARGLEGSVNPARILTLFLAATPGEFDNALTYMSAHHNAVLLQMLDAATDPNFQQFVGAMTRTQTEAFLANVSAWNSVYYRRFIPKFKTARLLATGQAHVGHYRWRGGSGPDPTAGYQVNTQTNWAHQNDFARWVRGLGPVPNNNSVMNCWQGVLFLAYEAGLVSLAWLQSMDQAAAAAATGTTGDQNAKTRAYYSVLERAMYSGSRTQVTFDATGRSSPDMPAGQMVFINNLAHVLLSKGTRDGVGRQTVLSLWIFPAHLPAALPLSQLTSYGVLQDTTLEEVHPAARRQPTDRIEYGAPPW